MPPSQTLTSSAPKCEIRQKSAVGCLRHRLEPRRQDHIRGLNLKGFLRAVASNCFVDVADDAEPAWPVVCGIVEYRNVNCKRTLASPKDKVVVVSGESQENVLWLAKDAVARNS